MMHNRTHHPTHEPTSSNIEGLLHIKTVTNPLQYLEVLDQQILHHTLGHRFGDTGKQMRRLHHSRLEQRFAPRRSRHLSKQRRDPIPQLLDQLPHRGHRDRLNRRNPRQRRTKRKIRFPQRRCNLIRRNRQRTQNLQFGVLNLRPGLLSQVAQRRHRSDQVLHRRITGQQRLKLPRHRIRRLTGQRRGHLRLRLLQRRRRIRQLLRRTIPIASKSKHRRLITLRPLLTRQIRNPLQLRRNLNTHPTPSPPGDAQVSATEFRCWVVGRQASDWVGRGPLSAHRWWPLAPQ